MRRLSERPTTVGILRRLSERPTIGILRRLPQRPTIGILRRLPEGLLLAFWEVLLTGLLLAFWEDCLKGLLLAFWEDFLRGLLLAFCIRTLIKTGVRVIAMYSNVFTTESVKYYWKGYFVLFLLKCSEVLRGSSRRLWLGPPRLAETALRPTKARWDCA